MLQCYNRGCGQKYNPDDNEDSCRHHPGLPYFHDAYKGWSCCKKKTTDFTEFLNIKGCTVSKHSNVKPVELEKPIEKTNIEEVIKNAKRPPEPIFTKRPSYDSPLIHITPVVVQTLKEAIDNLGPSVIKNDVENNPAEIKIGTPCRNSGCQCSYTSSPDSDDTECRYHPGVAIFHEGMKFWSCCTKRTSDFTDFMKQPGCSYGKHKWIDDKSDKKQVECRYDWHQTPSTVVVAVYAKLYHYEKSFVKVNPIRLQVSLVFPEQGNATFGFDLELRGVIKAADTKVTMSNTKVEITMHKADSISWPNLDFPKDKVKGEKTRENNVTKSDEFVREGSSDVDLDDIEPMTGLKISNLS